MPIHNEDLRSNLIFLVSNVRFKFSVVHTPTGYHQGRTEPVNRSMTGAPFTNSDVSAPKNSKVRLDLFIYDQKNDVHIC